MTDISDDVVIPSQTTKMKKKKRKIVVNVTNLQSIKNSQLLGCGFPMNNYEMSCTRLDG